MKKRYYLLLILASLGRGPAAFAEGPPALTGIWAHDGSEKLPRTELRGNSPRNSVWDGHHIRIFGARNEVVSFAVVVESAEKTTEAVQVRFDRLKQKNGKTEIRTTAQNSKTLFDFPQRPIEVFYVRYLPIRGISLMSYDTYDERHSPKRFRRPHDEKGIGKGTWNDRPDHDREYPEIAVPIELHPSFQIEKGHQQLIWVDLYLRKNLPADTYTGSFEISVQGKTFKTLPVTLDVYPFTLPDLPSAKTMVFMGHPDVAYRYTGKEWPEPGSAAEKQTSLIRDRHFQLAHRHKISLIDENKNSGPIHSTRPLEEWKSRLNGKLFTREHGYEGPGEGVGNNIFSIGTYGQWDWKDAGELTMHERLNAWAKWFDVHAPDTELLLYLADESTEYSKIELWSKWMKKNSGPGKRIRSFSTLPLTDALKKTPSLDIAATWFNVGLPDLWKAAVDKNRALGRPLYFYNGKRPATGSFATEDDGSALRALAWTQYKHQIDRWFFWESTYYNNFQAKMGQTRLFRQAHTYGGRNEKPDPVRGETGWNYSNGDGVLFYPGTDRVYPEDSYGVPFPFASLRMKLWRRGIQDVDYLTLAKGAWPKAVAELVNKMVPRTLWENGVSDTRDPTWVRTPVSWSDRGEDWELARRQLAEWISAASLKSSGGGAKSK